MRLLASLARGQLGEQIPIDGGVRNLLVEACLELMHFTPRPGATLKQAHEWLRVLDNLAGSGLERVSDDGWVLKLMMRFASDGSLEWMKRFVSTFSNEDNPEWMKGLANAFRCLCQATSELERSGNHHALRALKAYQDRVWVMSIWAVWSAQGSESYGRTIATVAQDIDHFLEEYLDIGILPPNILAYAMGRNLIGRPEVLPGIPGADVLTEEAFRLWESADEKASAARRSRMLADVLAAAHECHVLYDAAKVLLKWALQRYETDHVSPPLDLYKEHQVVEELRVAMVDTLHSPGDNFISEPAMIAHLKSNQVSIQQALAEGIADAAMRNPLFPDVVITAWNQVVAEEGGQQQPGSVTLNLIRDAQERMRARFAGCFCDPVVVQKAQEIARRWRGSSEAAELAEEFDKIMSDQNSSHDQLKDILTEFPFVLIRRECHHSLRLVKSRDQIAKAIQELKGSRCPTCQETVDAVDVVLLGSPTDSD